MSDVFPRVPLLLEPVFSERPWGGKLLESRFGKSVPPGKTIGESWELSDHPNGRSRIAEGPFAGQEFGDVLRRFPRQMVGVDRLPERYPLLVKFIDAAEDLSIQVHPNDEQAKPKGDRGKTECWYVMECEPGAEIVFGLENGISAEDLRRGARDGSIEDMVARFPISPGMFLFVRAGTVHAILGGTVICEIQQSSDTTYRLWDWNRQPPRPLHIEESIEVTDWKASKISPLDVSEITQKPRVLTDNEFFRVRVLDVDNEMALPTDLSGSGLIIVCLKGGLTVTAPEGVSEMNTGNTAFIPATIERATRLTGNKARVLLAESKEL